MQVKVYDFQDGKKLILQKCENEIKDFTFDQRQIAIRKYDPSEWVLTPPIEIHVDSNVTLKGLADAILKYYPDIAVNYHLITFFF